MTAWNEGYISDSNYTYGYYGEMFPARLRFLLTAAGFAPPEAFERGGTACELGFGHGMSLNMNGVSSPLTWYGTDFNPAQTGFARKLAAASGASVTTFDQSFEEFCVREDLPDFDLICLHGIWSWISIQNQEHILDFIRRKLKVGGVVYISYNCSPGFTPYIPMREIFLEYATRMLPPGQSSTLSARQSIQFMEQILELAPLYDKVFPHYKAKLEQIKKQDTQYLPHEYLNQDWQIISFPQFARQMAKARISYACSAAFLNHVPSLNYSKEQLDFLNTIPDTGLREYLADFMTNNNFRWDIWGKGLERISPAAQAKILKDQQVVLLQSPQDVDLTIQGKRIKANLQEKIYAPILESLAGYQIKRMGDLTDKNLTLAQILEAVLCLAGKNSLAIGASHNQMKQSSRQSARLNRFLLSLPHEQARYLSSPLVGAVPAAATSRMFLTGFLSGNREADQMARNVLKHIQSQGHTLNVQGKAMADEAQALAYLKKTARDFFEKSIPLYKALGIL